jgi:hypothetical protein
MDRSTDADVVKAILRLCDEHGGVRVAKEDTADGIVLVLRGRSLDAHRLLLKRKGA